MKLTWCIGALTSAMVALSARAAQAAPDRATQQLTPTEIETDVAPPYRHAPSNKALQDTIWIADWNFDNGGACNSTGWTKIDNRILNDGSNYWSTTNQYNGAPGISGKAAKLGLHNLCWAADGYGNDWDYSIKVRYTGSGLTLRFRYLLDADEYDYMRVEADSGGASESRYNPVTGPDTQPSDYRWLLAAREGSNACPTCSGGTISVPLPDFGAPAVCGHRGWTTLGTKPGAVHCWGERTLRRQCRQLPDERGRSRHRRPVLRRFRR